MKKQCRKLLTLLLAVTLCAGLVPSATAAALPLPEALTAAGAFIMDYQTGEEIWSFNPDTELVPASMVKVMSMYLVFEALSDGRLQKDGYISISEEVEAFSQDPEWSNVPLSQTELYTVDELLRAVIGCSACAGAVAFAEAVAGSKEAFVALMNERAQQMGLDAVFVDVYGGSAENRITPRSMATLCCRLLHDYPDYLTYSSQPVISFRGVSYNNTNSLLRDTYTYTGTADGIKTGTTSAAGACICSTVTYQGNRLITVVMRSATGADRYYDTVKLIDYGFSYLGELIEDGWRYVSPSSFALRVDGEPVDICAYLIDDSNYFRLRDLAYMLKETPSSFEISYDETDRSVHLTTDAAYTPEGYEMKPLGSYQAMARHNSPPVTLNSLPLTLDTYLIGGSNYVKLRDVGTALGFGVDWDAENNCVLITSQE